MGQPVIPANGGMLVGPGLGALRRSGEVAGTFASSAALLSKEPPPPVVISL